MSRRLDAEEISRQLADLPGWHGDGEAIRRTYAFPEFLAGILAVDEIALLAEAMDHHPDLDIRWRTLHVLLTTHDAGGVTQLDIELAHQVHDAATALGAT
ncbi:MAG: 4a-hydroxytetrahydrobiopterin dehydratase [Candidatus Nanopelagicales bacterium]